MVKGLTHYENRAVLRILAAWASKMDSDMDFNAANELDGASQELLCDEMAPEDLLKTIVKVFDGKEQYMDDGLFGLNDPDHPTVKAA